MPVDSNATQFHPALVIGVLKKAAFISFIELAHFQIYGPWQQKHAPIVQGLAAKCGVLIFKQKFSDVLFSLLENYVIIQ